MNSRELDQKFRTKVRELGGELFIQAIDGRENLTEYLVILPGGCVGFIFLGVEGKAPQKILNKIYDLRRLGCAAGRIVEEKHINDALCYIMSRAYRDPDWYRFIAENGKKGEENGI